MAAKDIIHDAVREAVTTPTAKACGIYGLRVNCGGSRTEGDCAVDTLTKHRQIIKDILQRHAQTSGASTPGLETELIFDEQHDHYMLFRLGWWPKGRVHGTTVHVRLRNGKFWIEDDWTEEGIATDLLEAGVPQSDIVLAFHEPKMREYTEFAVA